MTHCEIVEAHWFLPATHERSGHVTYWRISNFSVVRKIRKFVAPTCSYTSGHNIRTNSGKLTNVKNYTFEACSKIWDQCCWILELCGTKIVAPSYVRDGKSLFRHAPGASKWAILISKRCLIINRTVVVNRVGCCNNFAYKQTVIQWEI